MQLLDSGLLSHLLYIPKVTEPDSGSVNDSIRDGVFIGNSSIYSMPFFLDTTKLLNPHILTVGMTGSGKTFLMRNLILRLSALHDSKIIMIDFTGEYEGHIRGMQQIVADTIDYSSTGIGYINLAGRSEQEKIRLAASRLTECLSFMRSSEIGSNRRVFIVLDEAWKLLRSEKSLEIIIREGRKYGVGLILSSQLIEDADNSILSNVATIFLFRTQNKKSLGRIAKNYNISDETISKVNGLDLGSCLIILVHKSSQKSAFFIKKVMGLDLGSPIKIKVDGSMGIEINSNEMEKILHRLCGEKGNEIMLQMNQCGSVNLGDLIKNAIGCGAASSAILLELRRLGLDDYSISDAFAYALYKPGDPNEVK